ncbi:hypothetical protein AB0D38_07305 [Streptomyces sp. NPDC048279]
MTPGQEWAVDDRTMATRGLPRRQPNPDGGLARPRWGRMPAAQT